MENKNKKNSRSSRMVEILPKASKALVDNNLIGSIISTISLSQTDALLCTTQTPNFEGKDFSSDSLYPEIYGNLTNANFKNARFVATSLVRVNLTGADFRGAFFNASAFENVDLTGADFRGATLLGVTFRGNTNFTGANFLGVTFNGVVIENNAIMKNTILINTTFNESQINANQTDVIKTNKNLIDKLINLIDKIITPDVSCQQKCQYQQLRSTFFNLVQNGQF